MTHRKEKRKEKRRKKEKELIKITLYYNLEFDLLGEQKNHKLLLNFHQQ